jgi:homoprotocatechuate degradation regulator HpaR
MNAKYPSTARSLPIALIRAREGVMAPIRGMLAETGISEQQWRVLRVLAEHGPLDNSTLATRASLLFPSMTRMAKKMCAAGLITQSKDNIDGRRQILQITDIGQKIIDDNVAQSAEIVGAFRAKLGDDNFEQLLDLLGMLDPHQKP